VSGLSLTWLMRLWCCPWITWAMVSPAIATALSNSTPAARAMHTFSAAMRV